jgi:transcriptional regulator with XRE-family HTH domain
MTATTAPTPMYGVGELLRDWRQRRRLSQLDLALDAQVSARHISFVETGRANPSRELVLHLAEQLEVPLRDRNSLLLAAGYAPVYPETPLDSDAMTPARHALEKILTGHAPYPAIIVNRRWDLVTANQPALAIMADGVDPKLLEPPANTMRVTLHPDGLAPRILNLADYSAHLMMRLHRQLIMSGDQEIAELLDELRGYPGVEELASVAVDTADLLFAPLRMALPDGAELTFFSTLATFGTALDITLAELSIESLFPGDAETEQLLRERY